MRDVLGRILDSGESETAFGRALLRERYRALQRQIPLLYVIALANFVGLALTSGPSVAKLTHPANLLIALILVRLVHWLRTRRRELPPARIVRELRKTLFLAAAFSLAAGFWASRLLIDGAPQQQELVILFASLASIGCAYGLSSFPAAARLPLLLFALPFSAVLAASPNPAHVGVGISLALITLLILRLVNLQNQGFVELVRSRSEIEIERERAQRAEQAALSEKARVKQVAESDSLTGIANRRAFLAALEARLAEAGAPDFTLALIDLDGFKPINDTFGHAAGDALLVEVSARLQRETGAGTLVARIGGDEFALLLPLGDEPAAVAMGEQICKLIGQPFRIEAREFRISACCGLVLLAPGGCDVTTALVRGDAALYHGKQRGRGCVALFTPALERAAQRRSAIERALRDPKMLGEIAVVYQPIFDLESGTLSAFEALARWSHPDLGPIAPSEFIPIIEQINVIETLSGTLLRRAAAEAVGWAETIRLSFNLSAVELCSPSSAERLLAIAAGEDLDPGRLQFEVTETALLADFEAGRVNLDRLRAAGARIVLDDFGAGYASVAYLRELCFDAIKLDGSLITRAVESPAALRLLKGVLSLCAALEVPCIAEHIERPEQLALLRRLGCRSGQGYALSPPVEAAAALAAARPVPLSLPKTRHNSRRAA